MIQQENKDPQPAEQKPGTADINVEMKLGTNKDSQPDPGDHIEDMVKQLAEQYEKDPAPAPKVTEAPLTGIKIFELCIKYYCIAFAILYVMHNARLRE